VIKRLPSVHSLQIVRTEPLVVGMSMSVPADAERVRAAVLAHFPVVWRFLRRMGVAEQDAEDAGQAVLLVFARKIGAVETGAERSFLLGTALRVAADYRRRGHRVREVSMELATESHPGPSQEHEVDLRLRRKWLDYVLERLAPELREVFVLAEIEEMTMAEIASVLGVPSGTVASRLRRAREAFAAEAVALRTMLREEVEHA
jgi:RNA polymerase sigma-70 factor (ECF subfamily)